ncbi:MAG: CocE/NonD family hydrolase [Acidobacteriota bacterium]|nr:CocE/NonD family hydrolase [Acidobacteriota bacterium]
MRQRPTPSRLAGLAVALFASVCVPRSQTATQQPPPLVVPPEVALQKNVMIPMRDGVRLAADVYLPAKNGAALAGKYPTILERTPYDKTGRGDVREAIFFATHGYAVVLNDTRGRFASEGVWRMMIDDGRDGYDTVEWVARQPWSDGKVGMIGTSYPGGTQHAAAEMNPPHLTTIIPVDSLSNVGIAGFRHGGAFELRFVNWIFTIGGPTARRALEDATIRDALARQAEQVRQHIWELPLKKGTTALKFIPEYEDWLVEAMRHGDYDDYWKQIGLSVVDHTDTYADIPVYHVTGWFDSWTRQVVMNYNALSKTKRAEQRLIIGPWTHGGEPRNFAGEVEFPREAALDFLNWHLRWFDHWMKGADNGAEKVAPVRIFVMGGGDGRKSPQGRMQHGGHWRDEQEFPLARTRYTPYYLHADGALSTEKPAEANSSTTYRFDPSNPVPTLGGNISSNAGLMDNGALDQRCRANVVGCRDLLPLSVRNDVLVFQTEPLAGDVEVTGPVEVKLWISSSAADTDFTAKLIDVYPPNPDYPAGFEMNVGDSIIRARYRESLSHQKLMKPGEVYPVTITLYPTSNLFVKGHRIRVDVSSSNFPRFDINPNTGEPLQTSRRYVVADNTVYHDRARPSHVVLPIIPAK